MERYCQNPLCENEAAKMVPVSVDQASDQKRALCAACEEVYSWGVQHGRIASVPKEVWVLHVTDGGRGGPCHGVQEQTKRPCTISSGTSGPARITAAPAICPVSASGWPSTTKRLGVDLFPASVDWS